MASSIVIETPATSACSYNVVCVPGLLRRLEEHIDFGAYSSVFIVTDENVAPHWLDSLALPTELPCAHVILPPGESAKTLTQVEAIWSGMMAAGCDRRTLVCNLGGGVIGDKGGFAASTYMRGVDFVQLPTTLLSMVDASVGGKLGVNLGGRKNMIGVFRQPKAVLIDLHTLDTLPKRETHSGFAEIIKHGLICDKSYFTKLKELGPDAYGHAEWADVIGRSCQIKAAVVRADEREGGVRKILNFGHTIGHAIESQLLTSETSLLHGEAIAIGMVAEALISQLSGRISAEDVSLIEEVLTLYHLPTRLPRSIPYELLLPEMLGDKKNVSGAIRWTLLEALGQACYDELIDEAIVREAIDLIQPDAKR